MVKIRLTYVKNSDEEKKVLKVLKEQFEIISISREYEGVERLNIVIYISM